MKLKVRTISEEIRQTQPFRSREEEATVALLRTAEVVRRRLAGAVEPYGITIQQYNILRILRGAGDAGLPTLDIAARTIEHTPGITRLLDRLETKKLIRRERCARDRRQVLCWISPSGLALLSALDDVVPRADADALSLLSEADLERLLRLLDLVRAGDAGNRSIGNRRPEQVVAGKGKKKREGELI